MADRFRTLAAGARDIIAAVDQSGCLTYVSPSVQPALGLDPADVVGSVLWELVHPDDVAAVHTMLTHLFRDGGTRSIEFQLLGAAGRWHRLDAIVQLVDGDSPVEAVLSATDVTERRHVEAALREREGQLRQARKMEVVGRLAGGIFHDFGNLLTVIIGESGKMLDGLPADSPLRAHAESIRQTAERAGSIVRQLSAPASPPVGLAQGGTETLLLVEDEEGVRELVRDMLTFAGYRVLEASAPSHAEQISQECGDTIHLLLTDVVMPEMSGVELSNRIRTHRPGLRVMYMSGFPDPSMGDGMGEAPGAHFIAKPFDRQKLLRSVRRALDATELA